MSDKSNSDPGQRLRKILSAKEEDSPTARLPRLNRSQQTPPRLVSPKTSSDESEQVTASSLKAGKFGPPFWTVTGMLSLIVNAVLIAILIILLRMLGGLQLTANDVSAGLLGGLYDNFVKMDRAHIVSVIPLQDSIPVQFDLQLNQVTNVVLSQDVTIDNALVTVQTGGLNISQARTTIVLPQGTTLPIVLNLTVPVNTTVPVIMSVPVDIPLASTDLHEPFVGLKEVVKPFYCAVEPNALDLDGQLVCR
jgi:hypothetical protein